MRLRDTGGRKQSVLRALRFRCHPTFADSSCYSLLYPLLCARPAIWGWPPNDPPKRSASSVILTSALLAEAGLKLMQALEGPSTRPQTHTVRISIAVVLKDVKSRVSRTSMKRIPTGNICKVSLIHSIRIGTGSRWQRACLDCELFGRTLLIGRIYRPLISLSVMSPRSFGTFRCCATAARRFQNS
ncbi:hypothetical protein VTK26DRAFT_5231 [Humicola hyalothermophila]